MTTTRQTRGDPPADTAEARAEQIAPDERAPEEPAARPVGRVIPEAPEPGAHALGRVVPEAPDPGAHAVGRVIPEAPARGARPLGRVIVDRPE
jgi:hypothetical protein